MTAPLLPTWRDRLRIAVDRTGRKHSFIAEEAGIAPATLSRILTGAHSNPGFETVVRIAHASGESIGWLVEERAFGFSRDDRERLLEAAENINRTLR